MLEARNDFKRRLRATAVRAARRGEPGLGLAIRRLNHAFGLAAEGAVERVDHHPHTTHVISSGPACVDAAHSCGAGLLRHFTVGSVGDVVPFLGRQHQTISYFGLTEAERESLAQGAGIAGVDRLVPIGRALDFGAQLGRIQLVERSHTPSRRPMKRNYFVMLRT